MAANRRDIENQRRLNEEIENQKSLEQELIAILARRAGVDSDILSDNQDINNVLQDQVKQMQFQVSEKRLIKDLGNDIVKLSEKSYALQKQELGTTKATADINKLQVKLEKNITLLEQQKNKLLKEGGELNKDIADSIDEQVKQATKLRKQLADIEDQSEEIRDNFGTKGFSGLADISNAIPGLRKFSDPFNKAAEASRGMAQQLSDAARSGGKGLTKEKIKQLGLEKQLGNLTGSAASTKIKGMSKFTKGTIAAKAGFKALGPIIKKALGPIAIITTLVDIAKFFVNAMFEADKQITDISKQMNITREEASGVRDRMFEVSDQASRFANIQEGNLLLQRDLVKGQTEFNDLMGTSVDLTSALGREGQVLLAQFSSISKFLKLSKDEQKGLLDLSLTTGESADDIKNSVLGTTRLRKAQTGILVDERDILENVLTASSATKLTMMGQKKELAGAAFEAAKLGLNFSDLEKTSGSLLDFQSSIEAEMKAELLTGKQLNLERARAAALAGDQETLAKELAKQIGTAEEFSKLNVIQQKALAESLGMNREELAETLISQENINKLRGKFNVLGEEALENLKTSGKIDEATFQNLKSGKAASIEYYNALKQSGMAQEEIIKLLGQESAKSLETQSAQDKFNDALNKAKDIFARLVDGGVLQSVSDILAGIADSALLSGYKEEGESRRIQSELQDMAAADPSSVTQRELDIAESASDQVTGAEKVGVVAGAALTGAAIGSIVPGVGTAIGAVVGGLIGGVSSLFAVEAADAYKEGKAEQLQAIAQEKGIALSEDATSGVAEDFIMRPGQGIQKFRKDDLVIGGTNLLGGDGGEVVTLLKELVAAVKEGGDVYIDGNKAGKSLALATSRMG